MPSDPIGSATVLVDGERVDDVDVYSYKKYRTVFINDLPVSESSGPKNVKVMYRGRSYMAEKFGNPNNQVPSYDFKVSNKI